MHFPNSQSRLSVIGPACEQNNNDSIINELNLLENGFESRVVKIQSFLYTQEAMTPQTPPQRFHDSFLHDFQGNVIPPISGRQLSPYNIIAQQSSHRLVVRKEHILSNRIAQSKGQDKKNIKKSIREQIMQENQLLQRRLSLNKHYMTAFPSHRHYVQSIDHNIVNPRETATQTPLSQKRVQEPTASAGKVDEASVRLEEQYNKSKVVKLYNFIVKQVPNCTSCDRLRMHLIKQGNNVALKCKQCDQASSSHHPLMGVLYDLENKGRFQEEVTAFQAALDSIEVQLAVIQAQAKGLESLKDKVISLKNLNRKKYKEINQSKFFLRKHLGNLQQNHIIELQRLLPKQYLEQFQLWTQIRQHHGSSLQGCAKQLCRIMPAHLLQSQSTSRLLSSLQKLLNYEKEEAVKISVSEHIKFPLKRMNCAVFVIDGSYSLPIFQDVRHLQLQFQNKKTLRELNLLFSNFPRQVYSLSFSYNHKLHSHISAEAFPFLRFVAALPSLEKMHITIQNVKDFADLLQMASVITPKTQLRVTMTRHIFSKTHLNLPLTYYQSLFDKLGSQITKIELDLPESADSPALLNYEQLLSFRYLSLFRLRRGDKNFKENKKIKVLESLQDSELDHKKELIFKKVIAIRGNFLRAIKKLSAVTFHKNAIQSILISMIGK